MSSHSRLTPKYQTSEVNDKTESDRKIFYIIQILRYFNWTFMQSLDN